MFVFGFGLFFRLICSRIGEWVFQLFITYVYNVCLGVKCAILEKNMTFSRHPQAHFINNRSMEVGFMKKFVFFCFTF